MTIPTLQTDRLILRAPAQRDFETYRAFYADGAASDFYGGPFDAVQAWKVLAGHIGHWHLRGYGMWVLERKDTGQTVGGCGFSWPSGWPRSELTWWIMPAHRRQGLATEASQAAIAFAYGTLGWDQVETHMRDENTAARALVRAMGGETIGRERFPDGFERDVFVLPRGVPNGPSLAGH